MSRKDKYGRGSAAANGEGFVDLAPGDTFAALEAQLKQRVADRFDNPVLGISASIGSKRNASELAKHLASGEEEEAHKFAAKNIGVLFARGQLGISHDDKKAVVGQRWITRFIRVFTPFRFAGEGYLATLTLKDVDPDKRIYAVEAVEINQDAKSRSTPRGAISEDLNSAPFQDLTSQLTSMVSYYVGDVNRTCPTFVGSVEPFTVNRTVELLENFLTSAISHQPLTTNHQSPTFSIIIPVYNVAPYLRECLDSVLAQTFTDWEAICVDDGSTDGSGAILDEYAGRDVRFRVIHQENAGVSVARNNAIEIATGAYVGFLDADDGFMPDWLMTWRNCIRYESPEMVYFSNPMISEEESHGSEILIGGHREVAKYFSHHPCGFKTVMFLLRLDRARIAKFKPGQRLNEDVLCFAEQMFTCERMYVSNAKGYCYRIRNDSAAHSSVSDIDDESFFLGLLSLIEKYKGDEYLDELRKWVALRVQFDLGHRLSHRRDGRRRVISALRVLFRNGHLTCEDYTRRYKIIVPLILRFGSIAWRFFERKG